MLRGWRMRLPRIFDVWHKRAIPHCPDIRPIGELQELVHDYSASFLCAGERRDKRARHGPAVHTKVRHGIGTCWANKTLSSVMLLTLVLSRISTPRCPSTF